MTDSAARDVDVTLYDTDKGREYLDSYEPFLGPLRDRPVRLLELGIGGGASLMLWRDYFPQGLIAGLDKEAVRVDDPSGRIRTYQGLQQDLDILDRIGRDLGPFDVVIDDASHLAALTKAAFWHLIEHHVKPRGLYIIEDWGTGYWDSWPDGHRYEQTNHGHGMVGFVKELVDECGMEDITKPGRGLSPYRAPRFAGIYVSSGHVVVRKA